jgi:hypothetical protein
MVVSEFMEQHVLPNGAAALAAQGLQARPGTGQPAPGTRQAGAVGGPAAGADSGGIMDHLFVTTGTAIADRWQENAHAGDMFSDNGTDAAAHDKTLIAKVITEGTSPASPGHCSRSWACS